MLNLYFMIKRIDLNNYLYLSLVGEYESFLTNAPFFKKRIIIQKAKTIMENKITGRYIIEKADW